MSESKSEVNLFFPTVVQTVEIAEAEQLKKDVTKGIETIRASEPNSIPDSWSCDLYTTIGAPTTLFQHKEFSGLGKIIMREANNFANTLELDTEKHPLRVTECWVNIYGEGHAQEVHQHANSVISGIYYVKAPEGSGELLFHSPYHDTMLDPPTLRASEINIPMVSFIPKEGMMVLFRSYVKHSVRPTKGNAERISIAFNLIM